MASPNMKQMAIANKQCAKAFRAVQLYENPTIEPIPGFTVTMSAAQIIELKQEFVSARAAVIAAINAVTS